MNKEEVKQMKKEVQQKVDEWIKTEEESGDIVQRVIVQAFILRWTILQRPRNICWITQKKFLPNINML